MQVAIVTGATGGIGFGCAVKLAEAGNAVLATGRDEGKLARLKDRLAEKTANGAQVATLAVDLVDDSAPRQITDAAVGHWGPTRFLFNAAGVGRPKPLREADDVPLGHLLGLMLRAPFRLVREVLPHTQPGRPIINITSTFA